MQAMIKLSTLTPNPDNPRTISEERIEKLAKSIEDFPKMMELRPIIVDEKSVILGGNMRFEALSRIGKKEVPNTWVKSAAKLTEDERRRFIIEDNVGFGEWDYAVLGDEWERIELTEWGFTTAELRKAFSGDDDEYTRKVTIPKYEPKNEKPPVSTLVDTTKTDELSREIRDSDLTKTEKDFLIAAARRHNVFNYKLIADFYAHSDEKVQNLMENSALVIIDFNKALEQGYVRLSDEIAEQYAEDYPE